MDAKVALGFDVALLLKCVIPIFPVFLVQVQKCSFGMKVTFLEIFVHNNFLACLGCESRFDVGD